MSEINKLDIDSSVKLKISTDLFIDINNNFVGENCLPEPRADTPSMATETTVDRPAQEGGKPIPAEIANAIGHNRVSINMAWLLNAGYLVMFMAAGFALLAAGFSQAKNVTHTVTMVLMVYVMGTLGWWMCGFAFMFGGIGSISTLGGSSVLDTEITLTVFGKPWGIIGLKGFFLAGTMSDVGVFGIFLFQKLFMDAANYIPTGAMAERWKYLALMIYALFMSMLLYPLFGNWVWGGGWLSQLGANYGLGHGHVDFAGGSVVHMVGGICALTGAIALGPREGKYTATGIPVVIPGHNIPMAILGTFILAFGWFGFNPGSTLAGTDLRIAIIATNTMLSSASGAVVATIYMWVRSGKPDPSMTANGLLAGLVAITAPCAFINSFSAFIIGAVAGVLVVKSTFFIERTLRVDDPAGAIAVHAVNGAWGVISLGLFADGTYGDGWNGVMREEFVKMYGTDGVRGLFYGDPSQLLAECIGGASNCIVIFVLSWLFFKLLDKLIGNRVSQADERQGLDVSELGVQG
ncbi:MAG TPA: ammonium transporter [Candidatus Tectomicrobia bacterium]